MDKSKLKASNGVPLTQSLFLEIAYSKDAVYTLKDDDYEYEGKIYPSLKRLYLEMEDPVEYEFAKTHLLGWSHWQRMCANKQIAKHVEEWRHELELHIRSRAVKAVIAKASCEQGINAAKWIAEKGWSKNSVGRPNKQEEAREKRIQSELEVDFASDWQRIAGER